MLSLTFSYLALITFSAYAVMAEVVSITNTYNVTSPEPNAPYVAGQMLPVRYTLPDSPDNSRVLSLSVYFTTSDSTLNFTEATITSNADISKGFSFRHTLGTTVYYEHELNYAIPNKTLAGNYNVVFVDSISQTNTSIPVVIRPYAAASQPTDAISSPRPSGSMFGLHSSASKFDTTFIVQCMIVPASALAWIAWR